MTRGKQTVLDGVLEREDTSLALGLVTDVRVLLAHADHDALVSWATDNGGEHGTGSVVTGKAGLAHTRTVVDNQLDGGGLMWAGVVTYCSYFVIHLQGGYNIYIYGI